MNRKRISPMKRKNRKLVDLPQGAKPRKGKKNKRFPRKAHLDNSVQDDVNNPLVKEEGGGTDIVVYDDKTLIGRALDAPAEIEVPEILYEFIYLIRDVQANYMRFLRDYYRKLDVGECDAGLQFATLQLAIVAAKIDQGQAEDVISAHLDHLESTIKYEKEETMNVAKENNDITPKAVEKMCRDFICNRTESMTRTRNVGMLASMGGAVAAGAVGMAIDGDVNARNMSTTAAAAVASVGVTSVLLSTLDKGDMSLTTGGLIGGGVGLTIGGATTLADMLLRDDGTTE